MTLSIYKNTATKAKNGKIYAFGRKSELNGRATSEGGYCLFRISENYNGQVRGGIEKKWVVVRADLSFEDAIRLMNRRCGYTAFNFTEKR